MQDALEYLYGFRVYENIIFCITNNDLICKYKDLINKFQKTSEVDFHKAIAEFAENEDSVVLKDFAARAFNSLESDIYLCLHRSDTSRCRVYCVDCLPEVHKPAPGNYDSLTLMYGDNFYSNLEFCKNNNEVIMANTRGFMTLQSFDRKTFIKFYEDNTNPRDFKIMREYWQRIFRHVDFPIWVDSDKKIYQGGNEKLLNKEIPVIGEELRKCTNRCQGIVNNPSQGIIPRGLWFEPEELDEKSLGWVIVGENAGKAKEWEKKLYTDPAITWKAMYKIWKEKIRPTNKYYTNSVKLINGLIGKPITDPSIDGSILWTDIIKCEYKENAAPDKTIKTCSQKFLNKELDLVPLDWPIIALGRKSFSELSNIFPCRLVIGVPHPSNPYNSGIFIKLLKLLEELHFNRQDLNGLLNCGKKSIWLPDYLKLLIDKKK